MSLFGSNFSSKIEQIICEIKSKMSCETGAIEVQLKGESMEICVEVTVEMEGIFGSN